MLLTILALSLGRHLPLHPLTGSPPQRLALAAVGDVMLDRYVGRRIDQFGPAFPLEMVAPELQKADLVIANLECPLTTAPPALEKRFIFRVNPANVAALKGIDIVSLANNHTLDCGEAGFAETQRTLAKALIATIGADSWKPLILQRNGLKIAIFAFSDFPENPTNASAKSVHRTPNSGPTYYNPARMRAAIAFMRPQVDDIIVFAHWGIEGTAVPSERQRMEAREMAEAGADLILGSHPHVLQPVERIGHTVVAYSMGNFVFDATKTEERKTAIFKFLLRPHEVSEWKLTHCRITNARPTVFRE